MIVLRKLKQNSGVLLGQPLSGDTDGSNKVFTAGHNFLSNSVSVTYNGQVLKKEVDFLVSAQDKITLIYLTPDNTDVLTINYEINYGA